jgi:hypothetical protein
LNHLHYSPCHSLDAHDGDAPKVPPRRDWELDQLLLLGLKRWKVQEKEQEGYVLDQSGWWHCETIEGKRESTFFRVSARRSRRVFFDQNIDLSTHFLIDIWSEYLLYLNGSISIELITS